MDDSIYRLRQRDILAICVMGLLLLGVVMVQSAAMSVTGEVKWQWTQRGMRHVMYAVVALVTFLAVGHMDYAKLVKRTASIGRNPVVWLTALAGFLCLIVLVPGIGLEVNGARRWLKLGPIQVQPSEMAKWSMVLFLAWWLTYRPVDVTKLGGFVLTLVPICTMCFLVVIQDFGTAALIGVCAMTMMLVGRVKWWHLAMVVPPALAAGFMAVHGRTGDSYRWRRMTAFLDPWADPQGTGYHMIQSLLSFATGGIGGKGLGNGIQKLGYLPEDTTDFIFAVICEEMGLFGAMLTVTLYMGILYTAWQVVKKQERDTLGRMLAFGVGSMIGIQAAINIAVATVSVPTKGMSLPLVSAGGSGLVITCAALGLLYSVTRFEHGEDVAEERLPLRGARMAMGV